MPPDPNQSRLRAGWPSRIPAVPPLLLIPSWITSLTVDRDLHDTDNLLFYYIPDLIDDPAAVVLNLLVTPLVNTETDQIVLVTLLIGTFGTLVERRFGAARTLLLFWGTSTAGALGGGILLHLLYPALADIPAIEEAWHRIFNGASAGGFGFMGAFAAIAARPWVWIGLFVLWEPGFYVLVSQDYTSVFHILAFTTGFFTSRALARRDAVTASG